VLHPITCEPVRDLGEFDVEANMAEFQRQITATLRENRDTAARFAGEWPPSLVVHDLMSLEGVLAARVAGVPSVYHSPGMFGAAETALEDTTGSFAEHGVPAWDPAQLSYMIDPTPHSLAPGAGGALRIPVRYVAYNGPGEAPDWLLARPERPRVCLIWGNAAPAIFGPHVPALRHAIEAVASLGAELVLTAGRRQVEALGDLPGSVRVLSEFPLHLLLEASDALIHMGSVNPMMTGAAAGLPQLILPLTDDQIEMGRRFAEGGSARRLLGLSATEDEVRAEVGTLLRDTGLRAAAERIRAENAERPAPVELAGPLERLAATGELGEADLPGMPAIPGHPAGIAPDRVAP
jgi:hypothetical protein